MTENLEDASARSSLKAEVTYRQEKEVLPLDNWSNSGDLLSCSGNINDGTDTSQRHLPAHARHLAIGTRRCVVRRHHLARLHNTTQTPRIIDVVKLRVRGPKRLRLRRRALNVLIRTFGNDWQCALGQHIRTLVHGNVFVRNAIPLRLGKRVDGFPARAVFQCLVSIHADVVASARLVYVQYVDSAAIWCGQLDARIRAGWCHREVGDTVCVD